MINYQNILSKLNTTYSLEEVLTSFGFYKFRQIVGNDRIVCYHNTIEGNSGKRTHRRTESGWWMWIARNVVEKLVNVQKAIT